LGGQSPIVVPDGYDITFLNRSPIPCALGEDGYIYAMATDRLSTGTGVQAMGGVYLLVAKLEDAKELGGAAFQIHKIAETLITARAGNEAGGISSEASQTGRPTVIKQDGLLHFFYESERPLDSDFYSSSDVAEVDAMRVTIDTASSGIEIADRISALSVSNMKAEAAATAAEGWAEAAEAAAANRVINTEVNFVIGDPWADYEAVENYLKDFVFGPDALVNILYPDGVTILEAPMLPKHPQSHLIQIKGQNGYITKNGATVYSVEANGDGWDVTYAMSSVAGISAGMTSRQVNAGNSGAARMFVPLQGRISTDGTTAVATGASGEARFNARNVAFGASPTHGVDLDHIVIDGAEYGVTTVTNNESLVLDGTPAATVVSHGLAATASSIGTGTIEITGTALTGTGTAFTTELHPGALIAAYWNDGSYWVPYIARVASVESDTGATLEWAPARDITAGASFWVHENFWAHMGGFEITDVDAVNNRITVYNSSKVQPCENVGMDIDLRIIKSTLKMGVDGAALRVPFGSSLGLIDEVGLVGNGGGSSQTTGGIVAGRDEADPLLIIAPGGEVRTGDQIVITGFAGPALNSRWGGTIMSDGLASSNCYRAGAVTTNGSLFIRSGYHVGHTVGGVTCVLQGHVNAEESRFAGCGGTAFNLTTGNIHAAFCVSAFNDADVTAEGGEVNTMDSVLCIGADGVSIDADGGVVTGTDSAVFGANGHGQVASRGGSIRMDITPVTGCNGYGERVATGGLANSNGSDRVGNVSGGRYVSGPTGALDCAGGRETGNGGYGYATDNKYSRSRRTGGSTSQRNVSGAASVGANDVFLTS
ncbi:MAG: hypothetical protein CL484_03270, partial [Acidobacteria bacterium]|nr:hypothetical protein [Acidobacteriota bacterium]